MTFLDGAGRTIAGVDGCKAGWIAVSLTPGQDCAWAVFENFGALVKSYPDETMIAVDMPIGLPDVSAEGGRGAERAARTVLKSRKSSVFSIPSRSAVYLERGPLTPFALRRAARARVSQHAKNTSVPSRGVTFQAFSIFPKIREIDELLRGDIALAKRVFESHPEVAFWKLNGETEMVAPKKSLAGANERRAILQKCGLPSQFLQFVPSKSVAMDDFLDACAMLVIALRISRGEALPFSNPPGRDSFGLPIAIWA